MDEFGYYNLSLQETTQLFGVSEEDVRSLAQRGALEARFREGQWWVHLGPRRNEHAHVRLWHGTDRDCIDSIVEFGFRTETRGKQAWFTTRELGARLHAIGRAQRRHSVPVLVGCEVDLEKYPLFWKHTLHVYVFHQPLGPEVIRSVQAVDDREQSRKFRMRAKKTARGSWVNVGVTKNAGALGVLFWINMYLDKNGLEPVTLEDPIVQNVVQWVERQYREGRDDAITDRELEVITAPLLTGRQGV